MEEVELYTLQVDYVETHRKVVTQSNIGEWEVRVGCNCVMHHVVPSLQKERGCLSVCLSGSLGYS